MHAVEFQAYGTPSSVAESVQLSNPPSPEPGQVLIKVEACPINPSDLLRLRGVYGDSSESPGRSGAGSQGVGIILEVGSGVTHLKPGDLVPLHTYFAKVPIWREYLLHDARNLFSIPNGDLLQLAMTPGNPPSAWLILNNYETLDTGDWIIQNAANSTVGYYIDQISSSKQVNVINVVRSQAAYDGLSRNGRTNIILEKDLDLQTLLRLTDGKLPKLAIDAVAGESGSKLIHSIEDSGTIVNYGMLSGKSICYEPKHTVFRDIKINGFWLQRWWEETEIEKIIDVTKYAAGQISNGTLSIPIDQVFSFADARKALRRIEDGEANGKVFLVPPNSQYL